MTNKYLYKKEDFTLERLEQVVKDMYKETTAPRNMIMFTDELGLRHFNAQVAYQAFPTSENKLHLEKIQAEISARIKHNQIKRDGEFAEKWGIHLFNFLKNLGKEIKDVTCMSWIVDYPVELDEDEYVKVRFYKGKFDVLKDSGYGYGGNNILEEDISLGRVKELLCN